MNDEELIEKIHENTSEGMAVAIDMYGGAVKTICRSIMGGFQSEDIEEAVSDSFVAMWQALDRGRYNGDISLKYYLYGIARKTALNHRRELMKKAPTEDIDNVIQMADGDVELEAMRKMEYQVLNDLIMELHSPDREIFLYRYYEQYSVKEIAAKLMLSAKAVENKLTRGRAKLKKKLVQCGITF